MTLIFNLLVVVFCSTLLRRILKLCLNSIRQSYQDPAVSVMVCREDGDICVVVYIGPIFLATLFQINFQASSSSKSLILFISPSCIYIFQYRINSRKIFIKLSPANLWVVEMRIFFNFCLHFLTFLQGSRITFMIKSWNFLKCLVLKQILKCICKL